MRIQSKNFNIQQIADSGQCFRLNRQEENRYNLVACGKYLELLQVSEEEIELSCSEREYEEIWKGYFDMDYDYQHLVAALMNGEDTFLRSAAEYGRGIRILRQDFFEILISFIISQNKNIPSIKSTVEAISRRYGTLIASGGSKGQHYYAFPSPQQLAMANREELRELKVGYRDEYILRAARAAAEGELDLGNMGSYGYREAFQRLTALHGIGEKVANCICLYGLHHIEVFPVDVWIKRILKEVYQDRFDPGQYEGYAGIVQQYMFFYMRNKK